MRIPTVETTETKILASDNDFTVKDESYKVKNGKEVSLNTKKKSVDNEDSEFKITSEDEEENKTFEKKHYDYD